MKPVVFAGPSIYGIELEQLAGCDLRPPAASGDILHAVESGTRTIGLIDGLYGDCAAVWHKEILHAISRGVVVAGAASMGALRAAECHLFGMIGVGDIFESYRNGQRTSDADVAVSHAPSDLGFRPLTIALVDAQATITACRQHFDASGFESLMEAAGHLHFTRRTWRSVVAKAGFGDEHAGLLAASAISVKRNDAIGLLDALANNTLVPHEGASYKFQNTMFFSALSDRLLTRGNTR